MDGIIEMLRLNNARNAVINLIVKEERAQKRLLCLLTLRSGVEFGRDARIIVCDK